jgi:hypothetical protein
MIKKRILTHGAPLAFFFVLGVFCISPQKGSIQDHAAKAVSVPIRISANSRTISSTSTGSGCLRNS